MLELNLKERIYITEYLGMFRGSLAETSIAMKDAEQVELIGEEAKLINLKIDGGVATWDPSKDYSKKIELSKMMLKFILKKMNQKDKEKQLQIAELEVFETLKAKLLKALEFDEIEETES